MTRRTSSCSSSQAGLVLATRYSHHTRTGGGAIFSVLAIFASSPSHTRMPLTSACLNVTSRESELKGQEPEYPNQERKPDTCSQSQGLFRARASRQQCSKLQAATHSWSTPIVLSWATLISALQQAACAQITGVSWGIPPYNHMPLYRHLAAYATALSNNITILHWL